MFVILVSILGMITAVSTSARQIEEPKHILVLNSYHEGFTWTREVAEGIVDTLQNSDYMLDISIEYMDWKNYPTKENLDRLSEYYRYKYKDRKIHTIITSDDAALEFSLKNRAELFSNAPVVFCGVNEMGVASILPGYENVTGVLEQVDPGDTIKLAVEAMPDLKKIYLVYDNTESAMSSGQLAISTLKKIRPDIEGISLNNMTYEEVFDAIDQAEPDSAVFIVSFYSDKAGRSMSFEKLCHKVSQLSKVPVLTSMISPSAMVLSGEVC